MNNLEYWEKFEKTGSISDYLNYTACTVEDCTRHFVNEIKEGVFNSDRNDCDGNRIISNAHWGLR